MREKLKSKKFKLKVLAFLMIFNLIALYFYIQKTYYIGAFFSSSFGINLDPDTQIFWYISTVIFPYIFGFLALGKNIKTPIYSYIIYHFALNTLMLIGFMTNVEVQEFLLSVIIEFVIATVLIIFIKLDEKHKKPELQEENKN